MHQDQLRGLRPDDVKNEMIKQFTKHIDDEMLAEPDDSEIKVKLVIIGPTNAGKSSWVNRLINKKFDAIMDPTIGAKFSLQAVALGDLTYTFEIWDVSGDEMYKSLVPMYLQYAQAVVVCYDVTASTSFEEAKTWLQYVLNSEANRNDTTICFVGLKCDLAAAANFLVSEEVAKKFFVEEMRQNERFFFPSVSSKTNENVEDVILTIAEYFDEKGIKAPRASVLDPDVAYNLPKIEPKQKEVEGCEKLWNQYFNEENYKKIKEKINAFTEATRIKLLACFENSKEMSAQAYDSTKKNMKELTKTIDRKSKKIGQQVKTRAAVLIRKFESTKGPILPEKENKKEEDSDDRSLITGDNDEYEEVTRRVSKKLEEDERDAIVKGKHQIPQITKLKR